MQKKKLKAFAVWFKVVIVAKHNPIIKLKRVKKCSEEIKTIAINGFVRSKTPEDGLMVTINHGGVQISCYLRDSDIQLAAYSEFGEEVEASSWEPTTGE